MINGHEAGSWNSNNDQFLILLIKNVYLLISHNSKACLGLVFITLSNRKKFNLNINKLTTHVMLKLKRLPCIQRGSLLD